MRPRSLILFAAMVVVALTASTAPASGPYDFELQQLGEGIYVAIRPGSTRIPVEGNATILINDRERPPNVNHYHTDGIFRETPEFASILHADIVPDTGGDTIFVSLAAAYEALSDGMKAYLEPLSATNEFMKLHGSPTKTRSWKGDNFERMDAMRRDNPPVVHPLVKHHPVTGKKHLYLSESFTTHILGVEAEESQRLLDFLFRHVAKPEFQCRFAWRPGSMAFWDNRAALHYAVADYWPETRRMNRITIETDKIGGA